MSTRIGARTEPKESELDERFITPFGLITAAVIVVCFFFASHFWDASRTANASALDYKFGDKNEAADSLRVVGGLSTTFRLLFASWGCFCFAIAPRSRPNVSSPFFWSLLSVSLILVLSVFWSVKPSQTAFKLAVLISVAIGAAGIAAKFSLKEILSILTCACLSFNLLGIIAEISFGNFRLSSGYRFVGTTHPNYEAIFASFLCLFSRLYSFRFATRSFLGFGLFAFGMAVVLITKSRTTLAGLLFSLIFAQLIIARGVNRMLLFTTLLVVASLGLVGTSMMSQGSSAQLGKAVNMGRSNDSSLSGRLPLWEELLISINKKPILGHGYLAYWDSKQVEYLSEKFRWEISHGHNVYLDILLDVGYIGLSLVLLAILLAFVEAARLYSDRYRIEYAIVFGLFAYACINGLGESIFKHPSFYFFAVATCCFSMLKDPYKPKHR